MARYIDIDKMNRWTEVDQKCCSRDNCASTDYDCNECYYNNGGAEDVAPVIHAKWESKLADNGWKDVSCSNCKHTINVDVHCSVDYKYCPYCGAKMNQR